MDHPITVIDAARNTLGEPTGIGELLDEHMRRIVGAEADMLAAYAAALRAVPVGAPERNVLEDQFGRYRTIVELMRLDRITAIQAQRGRRA